MRFALPVILPLLVTCYACAAPTDEAVDSSGAAASQTSTGAIDRLADAAQFIRRTETVGSEEQEDFFFERSRMQQVMTVLGASPSTPRGSAACGAPRFSLEFLDGSKKRIATLDVCSELRSTSVLKTGSSSSSFTIDPSLLSTILQAPTARELMFGVTSVVPSAGAALTGTAATDFARGIELSRTPVQVVGCPGEPAKTTAGLPSSFELERGRRAIGTLTIDCGAVGSNKAPALLKTPRKTHSVTVDLSALER